MFYKIRKVKLVFFIKRGEFTEKGGWKRNTHWIMNIKFFLYITRTLLYIMLIWFYKTLINYEYYFYKKGGIQGKSGGRTWHSLHYTNILLDIYIIIIFFYKIRWLFYKVRSVLYIITTKFFYKKGGKREKKGGKRSNLPTKREILYITPVSEFY